MARTVSQDGDGFWHVSGQPAAQFYATQTTATAVAQHLDAADLPTAGEPSTTVSEAEQTTAILAAGLAAQAASTAAGTASTAAAGAAATAATAETHAQTGIAAAAAASSAAAAAAAAASAAQSAETALAASLAPMFFDEKWRARFRELAPPNPVFQFWTLDLQGGAENADDSQWRMRNGATRSEDHPMSVYCHGAGQDVTKAHTRAVKNQLTDSWYFAGAGYFTGATIDGAADHRGFMLANVAQNQWISAGVHAAHPGHFSFSLVGGDGPGAGNVLVPSTVVYAPGFHTAEVRFNALTGIVQGSIDGEAWITITTVPHDLPAGLPSQDHGVFDGAGELYVTLAAVGTSL